MSKKVLFVYWHGLGDNILATPAITKYKAQTGNYVGWAMLRRFQGAELFRDYDYIDQLHWTSNAWDDFESYEKGQVIVREEGRKIAEKYGYDEMVVITHKNKKLNKIMRTAAEMGVELKEGERHTDYVYDEARIQSYYRSIRIPKDYVFFHGRAGVPNKRLTINRAQAFLDEKGIDLPIVSPDMTWDWTTTPVAFAVDVMRKAKHIIVADSVMYHIAHAYDLNIDLAYFARGKDIWRQVHPLESKGTENVIYA